MKLSLCIVALGLTLGMSLGAAPPVAPVTSSPTPAELARQRYDQVTPSLVAVQYVWQTELGRRELVGAGVVVRDDGLVIIPLAIVAAAIPDEQMKDFKIIVPRQDGDSDEVEAVFEGRDERSDIGFVRTKEPQKWKSIQFDEVPTDVGQYVYSVGILPKTAGYKSYFMEARVAATLRGETPQVLVDGGLAAGFSPVFNGDGKAIGLVLPQPNGPLLLNNPADQLAAAQVPPRFFVPTRFFDASLKDPPTAEHPLKLPWIGVPQLTGLTRDVADLFNLKNQPAIQVGEVIHDTPGEEAGLKRGDIIVKVNGEPLERGDEPEELPQIFRRRLLRMKPGQTVIFSVLRKRGEPLQDIKLTLGEQPPRANTAKRYFADDLGFAVRDSVFIDLYARRLAADAKGIVVALIRPQSSAESGGLRFNDLIQRLNGEPVTDVKQFQEAYEQLRKDKPKDAVVLVVLRDGRQDTIRIEPPQ